MRSSIGYFVSTFLIISCTNRTPQQRLTAFINDPENKIVQSIQVGDVKAIAKWLPPNYPNIQKGSETSAPDKPQSKTYTPNGDYCYFNVKFEKNSIEKPANEKKLYLNFDMQNDFTVSCAGDSLSPVICQKIETGISGRYEYIVALQNSNNRLSTNDFTLYYKDKIFGIGLIAFVYSQKDIRKIPRV
jgi:hypothetical protein